MNIPVNSVEHTATSDVSSNDFIFHVHAADKNDNLDGRIDRLIYNPGDKTATLEYQNADGTYGKPETYQTQQTPDGIAIVGAHLDVDNSGVIDANISKAMPKQNLDIDATALLFPIPTKQGTTYALNGISDALNQQANASMGPDLQNLITHWYQSMSSPVLSDDAKKALTQSMYAAVNAAQTADHVSAKGYINQNYDVLGDLETNMLSNRVNDGLGNTANVISVIYENMDLNGDKVPDIIMNSQIRSLNNIPTSGFYSASIMPTETRKISRS